MGCTRIVQWAVLAGDGWEGVIGGVSGVSRDAEGYFGTSVRGGMNCALV